MDPSSDVVIQGIIILILLILSGFFSSTETALTTVNRIRMRTLEESGSKAAMYVNKVIEDQGKMLSAILIGNNIVNLYASSMVTTLVTDLWGSKVVGLATGVLTLLILIFGEITPKTMATPVSYTHLKAEEKGRDGKEGRINYSSGSAVWYSFRWNHGRN